MKNAVIVLGVLLSLAIVDTSEACNRCGLFGRRCVVQQRFVQHKAVKAVKAIKVVPQVAYQAPSQTIVLQNNYPAPLVSPIAKQGATILGYDAYAEPYRVDIEDLIHKQFQLADNLNNSLTKTQSQITSTIALQIAGQTEVEKIRAAAAHLKAANVGSTSTQSITIKQQGGRTSVTTQPPAKPEQPPDPDAPPQEPEPWSESDAPAAFATCVKCHSGATPKGKLSLDQSLFEPALITNALRQIKDGQMPPPESGITLSQQEKGEIMQYLLSRDSSAQPEEPQ